MADKEKVEEKKEATEPKAEAEKESFDKAQDKEEVKEDKKPEEIKEEKPEEKVEEKKAEEPKENPKKEEKKPEPTGKFKALIKDIESLSVLELAELVKALEERFGVSAAAPMVAAVPGAAAAGEEEATAKATYDIELTASGEQKINVIKALREVNPDLGLKEAKDIVDAAPKMLKTEVKKEEAEAIKKKIETAGGKVTLK